MHQTQYHIFQRSFKDDVPIKGSFYEFELQETHCPKIYLIEKKLIYRKKNGINQVRVQWLGFKTPIWINRSDVIK